MTLRKPSTLILVCILAVYCAFLTRTYYWDGVLFSLQIEQVYRGELPFVALFHANHLLYSPFGYLLYWAATACHIQARAITLLQIWNALISALTGYRLYLFARRESNSEQVAIFCWVLFAFGATWWKFSTDADAYIISVRLLLLAVLFASEEKPHKLLAAGLCHTGAMLFHELAVFGYAPVLAAIWLQREGRYRRMAAYLGLTGACVAGAYLACYHAGAGADRATFLSWIAHFAPDTPVTHRIGQLVTAYAGSYLKLFFGGKLSLIRDFFSPAIGVALAVCITTAVWGIRRIPLPGGRGSEVPRESARIILWIWFVPAALFLALFDPGSAFHKLFVWPAIVLLIGIEIPWITRHSRAAIAFAVAIAAWNFAAFIYPHSRPEADPVLVFAKRMDKELPRNASIYYAAFSPDDWFLAYFAPGRQWRPLPAPSTGAVCFDSTALNELKGAGATDPAMRWALVNAQHNIRLECRR